MIRVTALMLSLLVLMNPHTAAGHRFFPDTELRASHKPVHVYKVPWPKPRYRIMLANISCYTANSDECGKGDGITASGKAAKAGHTIAMDGVPFGTRVEIDGHIYTVEDRFGGGYTNRIDIFCDSKAEAFRFGRQHKNVKILED